MANTTIFLTGASSGIGAALAVEFARRGAYVALSARREELLERVAAQVHDAGGRSVVMPLDVENYDAVFETLRRAERDLGSLDMVIANAGISTTGHATGVPWAEVARTIDINVKGAMATLLSAIPMMLAQQRGHLVGVSSLAGRRGLPESAAYSASKAALSTFLESLRIDLAVANVRVTDVQPGFIETPMTAKNKFHMPYLWTAERAARHIASRLEHTPPLIAFPWQMDLITRAARWLPTWLYDPLLRMLRTPV